MGIKQTLANFMREPAYNPMDLEELIAIFDIKKNEYTAFKKILRMMESEGIIKKTKRNKFIYKNKNLYKQRIIYTKLKKF